MILNNQIPNKDYVYNALLRYNYLPIGKKHPDDIPFKVFTTEEFTPDLADQMLCVAKPRKNKGYDQIEYRVTRLPNVTRLMHIPHPLPYARLCQCISNNWNKSAIIRICQNPNSHLKPAKHDNDRLIMGEYEHLEQVSMIDGEKFPDLSSKLQISTGKFYKVTADISSFFPSIYTHTIPWALVGRDKTKADSGGKKLWYNQLDILQRELKRRESLGIPIGPATSNIISEIILSEVDETLLRTDKTYQFTRYIDDYEYYCETREQADNFILNLEQELRKYLLNLNPRKVKIEELPISYQEQWIITLKNYLPLQEKLSPRDVMSFLDSAVDLQKHHPEKNVLKYAARFIANSNKLDRQSADFFLKYLIALAVYNPSVLPVLCQIAKENDIGSDLDIIPVLKQSIKFQRSDAICWCLYLMGICGITVSEKLSETIIETNDCMSMGMLIALKQHEHKVCTFLNDLKLKTNYNLDQYWILLHQLAPSGKIFDNYLEKSGLKFLRDNNVEFIKPVNSQT